MQRKSKREEVTITYGQLYRKLAEIDSLLPNAKKVLPKLNSYLEWTRENYHRMDKRAKAAVKSESHLKVEMLMGRVPNRDKSSRKGRKAT